MELLQRLFSPNRSNCECNKPCKVDKYLNAKNCSFQKGLFGELVLTCEDQIINRTAT